MKKKLIIFIPHINVGGVEKNLFIIANYLAKKINNISLITANKKYTKKLDKRIKILSPKNNKWENGSMYEKYAICLFILINTILRERNYLIFSFQANWYAIIIAKVFGIKIVTRSNTAPEGWSKNNLKKKIYKIIINYADKVIVNSMEFKKSLKKYFNVNSKCIYNPLNISTISKQALVKIKPYKFYKKDCLNLINIGRFTDQKNQLLILKSINNLKYKIPIKLLIIGRGPNYLFLRNFIKSHNLEKFVDLKKNIDNPYPYLKNSDIFILSSNYEGLPNVLLEAQYFKKLIISTKCPTGPKEILLNGRAGIFFKMNNYKDLCNKLLFVYKNKKKLKQKIETGFINLERFDEQKNLRKYYKTLLTFL